MPVYTIQFPASSARKNRDRNEMLQIVKATDKPSIRCCLKKSGHTIYTSDVCAHYELRRRDQSYVLALPPLQQESSSEDVNFYYAMAHMVMA